MSDDIQGPNSSYSNPFAVLLAGGVGGARAARALATVLPGDLLTVVGNVGDDDLLYGTHVSPDLDTVVYTLAGIEGPRGWGVAGDTFAVMDRLAELSVDTTFRLGDRDVATCLFRSTELAAGEPLSAVTTSIARALDVATPVLPATDDPVRTKILTGDGTWLDFQDYFVNRGHRDRVVAVRYDGVDRASPGPGVLRAIDGAALVVIAPSNPHLSIHPILAIPGIREAVAAKPRVVAVSPLFGGKALKGPADRVMRDLGLPPGSDGVVAAYDGLLTDLVVDTGDAGDLGGLPPSITGHATGTTMRTVDEGRRFARWFAEVFR
jgi:LPPG:FO 2-phospho-L-lactate transferase